MRVRSSLMASIYDKALKRKDVSGVVDKEAAKGVGKEGNRSKTGGAEEAALSGDLSILVSGARVADVRYLVQGRANKREGETADRNRKLVKEPKMVIQQRQELM